MQVKNAITAVFDGFSVQDHYGADKARAMCARALAACPLDSKTDAPLPQWAINILKFGMAGYRARIQMLFIHHAEITGEPVKHYLVEGDGKTPSWVGKNRSRAIREALRKEKEGKSE